MVFKKYKNINTQFLVFSLIAICLAIVVIMSIISYQSVKRERSNYIMDANEQLKLIENSINIFYDRIDKDINMMATNPIVMKADETITSYVNLTETVSMTPSKNGGLEQEIYEIFKLYADTHPGTEYVYFGMENGAYLQWPETITHKHYNPKERGWYKIGLSGNGAIIRTEPYVDTINNNMITSNVRSFTDANGKLIGVIAIDVQQTVISDMLSNMKTGVTDYSMIVHNNGVIMADGNNPKNNFKKIDEIGIEGLQGIMAESQKSFNVSIDGNKYLVIPRKVKHTDWILVSFISESELFLESKDLITTVLLASVIIFMLIAVIILTVTLRKIAEEEREKAELSRELALKSEQALLENEEVLRKMNDELESIVDSRTSELKTAMNQLFQSEKLASLGAMVGGVAHEINTPIGVCISSASHLNELNLRERNVLEEGRMTKQEFINYLYEIDECTNIINNNLFRAAEMVKSFKQIAVDQSSEVKERFGIVGYVNMLLISLKHELKKGKHQYSITSGEEIMIYSYPGVFSQIFTNLIMNSIIHGFANKDNGEIRIDLKKQGEKLSILYSDNGCGIPEENLNKIFDPFYTTNRKSGGTGLGLNIVYNLVVQKLGGTINCISDGSTGTSFIMELPLYENI